MKDGIINRQAKTRNRKQGRHKKSDQQQPQAARWDLTGRLVCPHCGNVGMHRDGNYYADGSAPLLCRSCGNRSLLSHSMRPL